MADHNDDHNRLDGMAEGPEGDTPMSFFDHLAELRKRLTRACLSLFVGTLICYAFVDQLTVFMQHPFSVAWKSAGIEGEATLLNLGALEVVLADVWVAVSAGIFVSSPFIFYQMWMFIAPGLYAKERRIVVPFAATGAIMFVAGAAFCYYVVLPVATEFFLVYTQKKAAASEIRILTNYSYNEYVSYVMKILVGFGMMFEMPLAVFFLAKAGIVTHRSLLRHWRAAILVITLASAILTPPDPVSIWLMGVPMTALYFVSVGVAYLVSKPETQALVPTDGGSSTDGE